MPAIARRIKARVFALVVVSLLSLQGCGIFVSHYDAGAYQYFTTLKAYHLKFLDDFVAGPGKSFDLAKIKSTCDVGDLKFREARAYAEGKDDKTRVDAVRLLNNVFQRDCDLLVKEKRLFGTGFAKQEAAEATTNYDFAIKGEASRVNAPVK